MAGVRGFDHPYLSGHGQVGGNRFLHCQGKEGSGHGHTSLVVASIPVMCHVKARWIDAWMDGWMDSLVGK